MEFVLNLATGFEAEVHSPELYSLLQPFHVIGSPERLRGRVDPAFSRFAIEHGIISGVSDFRLFLGGDLLLHYAPQRETLTVTLDDDNWEALRQQTRQAGLRPRWALCDAPGGELQENTRATAAHLS